MCTERVTFVQKKQKVDPLFAIIVQNGILKKKGNFKVFPLKDYFFRLILLVNNKYFILNWWKLFLITQESFQKTASYGQVISVSFPS